jgi:hypothetical protein
MALPNNAAPALPPPDAAGTQFAPYAADPDDVGFGLGRKMAAKLFMLALGALVIVPAAGSAFWPRDAGVSVTRSVELDGPFVEFTQTRERIQLRLAPAGSEDEKRARTGIVVRDTDGYELAIPLKRGQTWVSAELPADLGSSAELRISLQQ